MSVRVRKGIAFGLLGVAILATLAGLLPAQGIDWVYLGGFVLLGAAASVQGRSPENMAFLVAAAVLIQGLINILGLASLTKVVNGAFFVLAVVRFPDGLELLVKKKKMEEADAAQAPPQGTPFASGLGSGGRGGGSGAKTAYQARRAQAVFEEFQTFTQAQNPQQAAGDAKATEGKKSRGSGRRRARHSSQDRDRHRSKGKDPSRSGASSGKPTRSRSSRDDDAVSAAKPARPPRSSSGSSRSQEARDRLQAEQHALQREKERLAEEAHLAERKRRQEEERLKRERAALAKEREALKAQPPKPSSATDTRSPEAVLGINSTTYTLQELKEARKREAARWHPSSMQHKPKELIDMAEEELKKINLAYDKLKKKFE